VPSSQTAPFRICIPLKDIHKFFLKSHKTFYIKLFKFI
jgi:hypothetical protein